MDAFTQAALQETLRALQAITDVIDDPVHKGSNRVSKDNSHAIEIIEVAVENISAAIRAAGGKP